MNIQEITAKVEQALESADESLYVHMIAEQAGVTKDQATAALKRLAAHGLVDFTPTQGRWGNRYALTRSAKPVADAAPMAAMGGDEIGQKQPETRMDSGVGGGDQGGAETQPDTPANEAGGQETTGPACSISVSMTDQVAAAFQQMGIEPLGVSPELQQALQECEQANHNHEHDPKGGDQTDAPVAGPVEVAASVADLGRAETRMNSGPGQGTVDHFGQAEAAHLAAPGDDEIDAVFEAMPNGAAGFLKAWGYRQFAREILARFGRRAPGEAAPDNGLADVDCASMICWLRRRQTWPSVGMSGRMAGQIADMLEAAEVKASAPTAGETAAQGKRQKELIDAGPHGVFTLGALANRAFETTHDLAKAASVIALLDGTGHETFAEMEDYQQQALFALLDGVIGDAHSKAENLQHILEFAKVAA